MKTTIKVVVAPLVFFGMTLIGLPLLGLGLCVVIAYAASE